jgi:hypothetical protein
MRCRQGDIALVIDGARKDLGKMVTCLEPVPAGFYRDDLPPGTRQQIDPTLGPLWRVDRPISWGDQGQALMRLAPDSALMPIRPEADGEDEAVPNCKVKVVANGCS